MSITALPDAAAKAVEQIRLWPAHEWGSIVATFGPQMAAAFPVEEVPNAWAQIVAQVGELESIGDDAYVRVQGVFTVVDVPLQFEAGELVGRVSYDEQGRVAGLYFLNPDAVAAEQEKP
ncbi:MAG: DUF3887 domain-containing protein [Gordonia sp. (in: high G+C Gram-positive bacteria)]